MTATAGSITLYEELKLADLEYAKAQEKVAKEESEIEKD